MAQKTVCDSCGQDITNADGEPVDFRKVRLHLKAEIHSGSAWKEADICAACLHGAAKAHDKSPQPAPPFHSLRFGVWIKGVKCPGPHAAFIDRLTAELFLEKCYVEGEIR